jgi:hypothetical protein
MIIHVRTVEGIKMLAVCRECRSVVELVKGEMIQHDINIMQRQRCMATRFDWFFINSSEHDALRGVYEYSDLPD